MTTPADWYPDPTDPGMLRWWDGGAWTEHTQPAAPSGAAAPALETQQISPQQFPAEHYPAQQIAPQPFAPQPFATPAYGTSSFGSPAASGRVSAASPGARLAAYVIEGILGVVTFGIGWLIWAVIVGGDGQTPAKKLLGLRVINSATNQPASFARMLFLRGLVAGFVAGFAVPLTLGILLFMPFWDDQNRNIWDRVSGTHVVADPDNAWSR